MTETDIIKTPEYSIEACYVCSSIERRGRWLKVDMSMIEQIAEQFDVKETVCPDCLENEAVNFYNNIFGSFDSKEAYNPSTSKQN